jgi:hypothetical protein
MVIVDKPKKKQRGMQFCVPRSWRLSQPVYGLLEPQHLMLFASNKPRWLPYKHILLQLPIQESGLYVHVMNTLAFMCSNCKDQSHQLHSGNRREYLFKINPMLLHIPLHHRRRFMLDDTTLFILLRLEDLFETNGTVISRKLNGIMQPNVCK